MTATQKFFGTAVIIIAAAAMMGGCAAPHRLPAAHVGSIPVTHRVPASLPTTLTVVSLNVAHSRSMGIHQLFQSGDRAREHLDAVVAMIRRENPDVIALQELDGPSVWSGHFDHLGYLGERAGYAQLIRGTHVKAPGLDYGTALMGRYPMDEARSVGFSRALTVTQKGFVIARLRWPGSLTTEIDLVSVHFDPIRPRIRARQVHELATVIKQRGRPVIVMGDFNSDWYAEGSAVRLLGETLSLTNHGIRCEECYTERRLHGFVDWILASPELRFESFEILSDELSDHYAVAATLRLATPVMARASDSAGL